MRCGVILSICTGLGLVPYLSSSPHTISTGLPFTSVYFANYTVVAMSESFTFISQISSLIFFGSSLFLSTGFSFLISSIQVLVHFLLSPQSIFFIFFFQSLLNNLFCILLYFLLGYNVCPACIFCSEFLFFGG